MKSKNRILILGGRGFIGGSLTNFFWERGFEVASFTLDKIGSADRMAAIRNALANQISEYSPSIVINCLGVTNPDVLHQDPLAEVNLAIQITNALHGKGEVKRFFHLSSAAVYGETTHFAKESDSPAPINLYGQSKLAVENVFRDAANSIEAKHLLIRATVVFGAALGPKMFSGELFYAGIQGSQISAGAEFRSRDFIHIDDFGRIVQRLIEYPQKSKFEIINVGAGASTTLVEFANLTARTLGKSLDELVKFDSNKSEAGNPINSLVDVSKMELAIGYKPRFNLEARIAQTLTEIKRSLAN